MKVWSPVEEIQVLDDTEFLKVILEGVTVVLWLLA